MIVDLILNRKESEDDFYSENFISELRGYAQELKDEFIIACIEDAKGLNKERDISSAEYRIKSALIHYIVQNQYNLNICKYIMSRNWFYDDQTAILGLGVEI